MSEHMVEPANDRFTRWLNTALVGRWHVWYIPMTGRRQNTWCARPEGTELATLHAETASDLATKIAGQDKEAAARLGGLITDIAAEYA